jgi:RNA polymerase sigma-70 factor (ECF subfamily)
MMTSAEAAEHPLAPYAPAGPGFAAEVPADFETIYRQHFRFVWRTARRLGVERTWLEDAVQETFVVVHRRLADFQGRSTVKTWLYGIVRRVVADHRRGVRRKPGNAAPANHGSGESVHGDHGPEESIEQAERVRLLHKLLDQLDDDKREVFVLAELEEMTMAEIAEALGVNANTLSSRLRAARREFEEALDRATRVEGPPSTCARERSPR